MGAEMPLLPGAQAWSTAGGPVGALLCHGFTGSPKSLRPWAEHLANEGLTVRLPRLPGHGTRWQELAITQWEDWYAEIDRAFDELKSVCDDVFVMGLSMGGALALRMAEVHGADVRGLVLVNPSITSPQRAFKLVPLLKAVVPHLKGPLNDIRKPGADEGAYNRAPLAAVQSLTQLWLTVQDDLGKVDQPILVFRSREDHVVEPDSTAMLLERVSSDDIEERVLENSYHVATLDYDADEIFSDSVKFVRRLSFDALDLL